MGIKGILNFMSQKKRTVIEFKSKDFKASSQAVTDVILSLIEYRATKRMETVVGLCGGSSPASIFSSLASSYSTLSKTAQSSVFFLPLDERCLPHTDKDFNLNQITTQLFSHLLQAGHLSHSQIIWYEFNEKSSDYGCSDFQSKFQHLGSRLDIVIAGVGPDNHIASLFPDHPSLAFEGMRYEIVKDSPKPPPVRITATKNVITNAELTVGIFLKGKEKAYSDFKDESVNVADCPAKLLALNSSGHDSAKMLLLTDID